LMLSRHSLQLCCHHTHTGQPSGAGAMDGAGWLKCSPWPQLLPPLPRGPWLPPPGATAPGRGAGSPAAAGPRAPCWRGGEEDWGAGTPESRGEGAEGGGREEEEGVRAARDWGLPGRGGAKGAGGRRARGRGGRAAGAGGWGGPSPGQALYSPGPRVVSGRDWLRSQQKR
jgi:hypothetical protein